jgi:hypothetical protein
MQIELWALKWAFFEACKLVLPALVVYIVLTVKHRRFLKRIMKSIYQERLGKKTDYKDYIQKI